MKVIIIEKYEDGEYTINDTILVEKVEDSLNRDAGYYPRSRKLSNYKKAAI